MIRFAGIIASIMGSMRLSGSQSTCIRLLVATLLATFVLPAAIADDAINKSIELFEKQVRPTLIEQCIRCHGSEKQQGGLRLDTREGWSKGGDSGPPIVPGEPDKSLLLSAIRYENPDLEMPPRGKLPERTIKAIETWVEMGAVDPRTSMIDSPSKTQSGGTTVQQGRSFWSFQPVRKPAVPQVVNEAWPNSDIDRFVLARLEESGLTPVPDAQPRTLIRRLYYDLTGLPPTPEQIDEFLNDRSPTAYADLIDRLLDSHHFGERWGRHWLDVVRFAESSGGGRTLLLPNAWRYRDYVIDAFNADVPYDQFVTEQIAGDLLECDDWQQRRRNLIATAFLLLGPTNYEMQDKDILEMDVVDEQLDTMGKAFLGMTIGCARCHDHKFDPIPTRDYYAMAGILKSTQSLIHSNVSKWNSVGLPLPPDEEETFTSYDEKLAAVKLDLANAKKRWIDAGGKPEISTDSKSIDPQTLPGIVIDNPSAELTGKWIESTSIPGFVGEHYIHDATEDKGQKSVVYRPRLDASGSYEVRVSYSPGTNRSTRVPVHVYHNGGEQIIRVDQKQKPSIDDAFVSLGVFEFDPTREPRVVVSNEGTEDGVVIADAVVFLQPASSTSPLPAASPPQLESFKKEVDHLTRKVKSLEKTAPTRPLAMSTIDVEETGDIHLAIRGVTHQKGPLTQRGVMQVASWEKFPVIPSQQSGRKELADWIASEHNPLTARVMVNRIWYWLVGRGIVTSVDNFGSTGQPPTHPELLDHLASSFAEQRWSTKNLIREIVLSHVYRLSSQPDAVSEQIDPENRLLWRMNRKRLRAEDIRDSLQLVGGTLDFEYGGPNIKEGTTSEYGYEFDSTRRSVYVPVFRNRLPEIFEVFDFADPNIQRGKRNSSTVASQALLMMNHPLVIQQARLAAKKLLENSASDTDARIRHAYLQVLGRPASEQEQAVAVDLIASAGDDGVEHVRWAMLYQVLFQCIDFRYLD